MAESRKRRSVLRNLMDMNEPETKNGKPAAKPSNKPNRPRTPEVTNLDVICGDLTFKDGTTKHYSLSELSQLIADIKLVKNTRKLWVKAGADVKNATVYPNAELLEEVRRTTGHTYTDPKEAAEKEGYVLATLQVKLVKYKDGTWDRIPVKTEEGQFIVIDVDPAVTGTAEDA